jgi:hypothetical protein
VLFKRRPARKIWKPIKRSWRNDKERLKIIEGRNEGQPKRECRNNLLGFGTARNHFHAVCVETSLSTRTQRLALGNREHKRVPSKKFCLRI